MRSKTMEKIKNELISKIEEVSKKYQYYGFWKLGTAYVANVSREKNPYLYFPSEEYARKVLMEEFNSLTEDEFIPRETIGYLSFKDGDKLDIPFEVFKKKPLINMNIYTHEYTGSNYAEMVIEYDTYENERQICDRLFGRIMTNARKKYIKSLS